MTEESKENINVFTNEYHVKNVDVTPLSVEPEQKHHTIPTENDLAACQKKSAGGVGVSALASDSPVAIYSGEVSEKKSNAYGVNKNTAWPAPGKLIRITDPRAVAMTCAGVGCEICDAARTAAAKHNQSVCDSAQFGNMEAQA